MNRVTSAPLPVSSPDKDKTYAIEVDGVCFAYQAGCDVLQDVQLKLERGKFLALMGPNGSGKSTLLRLILGLQKPRCGSIRLLGQRVAQRRQHWRVGYVSQHALRFNPSFPATVREIVATGLSGKLGMFRFLKRQDWERVEEALCRVGMEDLGHRMVGALSGGQQQRMLIARSLVTHPELLILDEPTVGVDADHASRFYHFLGHLHREEGISLLLVTHDMGVVSSTVEHVACLNRSLFFHGKRADFAANKEALLSQTYGHPVRLIEHNHHVGRG